MTALDDTLILKELKEQLSELMKEDRVATLMKQKRDIKIKKTTLAIEAFSNSDESINGVQVVNSIFELPIGNTSDNAFDYPRNETWIGRIKAYMKYKNKALTVADIVKAVRPYEPTYSNEKLLGAVNNTVQTMYKRELLKIYKPHIKMKSFYYANPLWFDGDTLREEFIPNFKEQLAW